MIYFTQSQKGEHATVHLLYRTVIFIWDPIHTAQLTNFCFTVSSDNNTKATCFLAHAGAKKTD